MVCYRVLSPVLHPSPPFSPSRDMRKNYGPLEKPPFDASRQATYLGLPITKATDKTLTDRLPCLSQAFTDMS